MSRSLDESTDLTERHACAPPDAPMRGERAASIATLTQRVRQVALAQQDVIE